MTSNRAPSTIILGIDPGLKATGWGVIASTHAGLQLIAHGAVTTRPDTPFSARLHLLHQGLVAVLEEHKPHVAAIEKTFVNANPTSALKLGMARGVALLAPAQRYISVFEYSATQVKKTIVGVGHATKDQVELMVRRLLPEVGMTSKDAADALAIAICHAHHQNPVYERLAMAGGGPF
ncbi:MAG: crossover junction endodeoxyribonuclease RuvC [Holosporales bacterium]|jgi:crossover junction endodeoxyribonuclease RuvC|nr:crossover junction endodeoxyribonuclease RuvC [Holosporales bacterium]